MVNSVKSQPTLLVFLTYIMHDFSLDLISSMSCHSKFDTLHLNKYEEKKNHFPVLLTEVTHNICIRSRQFTVFVRTSSIASLSKYLQKPVAILSAYVLWIRIEVYNLPHRLFSHPANLGCRTIIQKAVVSAQALTEL